MIQIFLNDRKKLRQFGYNASFSHTNMSYIEKMTESSQAVSDNDQNDSAKNRLAWTLSFRIIQRK